MTDINSAHNAFVSIPASLVMASVDVEEAGAREQSAARVQEAASVMRITREADEGAGAVFLQIIQCRALLLAPQHTGFGKHAPMKHGELLA